MLVETKNCFCELLFKIKDKEFSDIIFAASFKLEIG